MLLGINKSSGIVSEFPSLKREMTGEQSELQGVYNKWKMEWSLCYQPIWSSMDQPISFYILNPYSIKWIYTSSHVRLKCIWWGMWVYWCSWSINNIKLFSRHKCLMKLCLILYMVGLKWGEG